MAYLNCFWHGPRLGDIETISLLSMLRQGEKVRLFSYERLASVPEGVEEVDAREVMPLEDMIFHHATGSASLGSNRFRYFLMRAGLGLWLDLDVLQLQPFACEEGDHIFGLEEPGRVNGAVLHLPRESGVVDALCRFAMKRYPIPPFYPLRRRLRLTRRFLTARPVPVDRLPWGVLGPDALSHFIGKSDMMALAKPAHVFYPVHHAQAHTLVSARHEIEPLLRPDTLAIHLWNEALRRPSAIRPDNPPGKLFVERESFVDRFARRELAYRIENLVE